jgi:hypothetical protein
MLAKGQVDVPIPMHIGIHESEVRIYLGDFNAIDMHSIHFDLIHLLRLMC